MMLRQRTLKSSIRAAGIGLHSGERIYLTVKPAAIDTGIVFRRTDLSPMVDIPAHADAVGETMMSTNLLRDGVRVATVEHLLSALAGLGVDNAIVEVSAQEIPIMDGSSGPFVFLIQSAGLIQQDAPKRFIRILRTIEVRDGDKWARFTPYDGFRLDFTIDFDHPAFLARPQSAELEFSTTAYVREIARARTFGFMKDIDALRASNLALGGSVENAIVVDEHGILNQEGLRYEDEFVKHKMLDAIGDLYLAGHAIIGHYEAFKSGHALNNQLVRRLLAEPQSHEQVSFGRAADAPIAYLDVSAFERAA